MAQDAAFANENPTPRIRAHRTDGFTLIELVMVAAIIGVLASIAVPNLTKLAHKSRRGEAYTALHAVAILQAQYFAEQGVYADNFDDLGFRIRSGRRLDAKTIQGPYYTYTIRGKNVGGLTNANYRVTAAGDIDPTDPVLDVLIIENRLTVVQ
jgi:prepilin-type N-terminal cleavage/methylation domain-containing protein